MITALVTLVVWVVHRLFRNADKDRALLVKAVRSGLRVARASHETSLRIEGILKNGICRADCVNYSPHPAILPIPKEGHP